MLIRVKRGLEAGRLSITPNMGEPLFTTDTKKLYIGDGVTPGGIAVDLGAPPAPVQSVAGKTGAVTLDKSDVGLSNADDTSDANKPISTATQTALDGKQNADPTLTSLAAHNTNGILTQTAADTFTGRTITGTTNQVTVTNGDGVAGNPTLSLPQSIHTGATPTFAGATLTNSAINTGDGVIDLITNKGLQLRNTVSTATFRLLPAGNDIFFQNTVSSGAIVFSGLNAADLTNDIIFKTTSAVKPGADSVVTLGTSSLYWKEGYIDKLFLNSTATLDGSTAGKITFTGHLASASNYGSDLGTAGGAFATVRAGVFRADYSVGLSFSAGSNIQFDTATGTKIGTATNQKLGFFNAAPVVQPSSTPANATDLASAIALVNDLKAKLIALGLIS